MERDGENERTRAKGIWPEYYCYIAPLSLSVRTESCCMSVCVVPNRFTL